MIASEKPEIQDDGSNMAFMQKNKLVFRVERESGTLGTKLCNEMTFILRHRRHMTACPISLRTQCNGLSVHD